MNYSSTRDHKVKVTAAQAITQGISKEGGLFVPEEFPKLAEQDFAALVEMSYNSRAKYILRSFLTDFTEEEIAKCVDGAYSVPKFEFESIAPLTKLHDFAHILELWHGPTCAFKDMALQLLPRLLTVSAGKVLRDTQIVILVATSGDTGKAALEGFKDVENTKILVFYPQEGVSPIQKLQMNTQEGGNVSVCAIEGNFDDAQSGVKKIFTDAAVQKKLGEHHMAFSSANSINWGRLVPQIIYYISAYCDLIRQEEICFGDKVNIVVPTGNFGNILAAYYAGKMGLPVAKLICASNSNNVLTDFLRTGTYDRNREFFTTISPSMDILISSNLERLLYDLSGGEDEQVAGWMDELAKTGRYTVSAELEQKLQELFYGGFCSDEETKACIHQLFEEYHYLCDTHTAVAVRVYERYREQTGDTTKTIIASTASPYKFPESVLEALTGEETSLDDFEKINRIQQISGLEIPDQIEALKRKQPRFNQVCTRDEMQQVVFNMLGI